MKLISKKYWQAMKNFVSLESHEKQISIKFGGFYLIKMNLVQTVLWTSTLKWQNYRQKYPWKYRPIYRMSANVSVGLYLGAIIVFKLASQFIPIGQFKS